MSAPQLRFKAESGKDYPSWNTRKLNALAKIYDGTHMTPEYKNSGVPFFSVEHLTSNNFKDTKFISEEIFEKENKKVKLEKGDILMTKIGDIGTAKYIDWDVRASFYVSLALIKQSSAVNSLFLARSIASPYFQKELHQRIIHVAFPKKINLGEIGECLVQLPCEQEQTKIANFLTAVDEKISQLTQKCELLTQYKKGVMQQIFSQELRFKDKGGRAFPVWEEKKLKDIAQIVGGGTPETGVKEYWNGDIQWFTPTELKSKYAAQSQRTITESGFKNSSAKILPIGTLLFSSRATVGDVSIALNPCTTNQGFQSLIVNDENNNEFIYYWIMNNKNAFLEKASGSTFLEISKKEIEKLSVQRPSIKEQNKIANFLTAIDDKITASQNQLAAANQYKQGLLQQMFV